MKSFSQRLGKPTAPLHSLCVRGLTPLQPLFCAVFAWIPARKTRKTRPTWAAETHFFPRSGGTA